MNAVFWMALITGCAASAEDLCRRTVANWIVVTAAMAGFLYHGARAGWAGLGFSLGGIATGFGLFLLFYALGGMGGGDVKLMAGFGALLGTSQILLAGLLAAILGALLAAACLLWHRFRGKCGADPRAIPYAPVITAGVWLALLGGA